jgi:penicillin-binding protein 2
MTFVRLLCLCAFVFSFSGSIFAENPYLQKLLHEKYASGESSILVVEVQTGNVLAAAHPDTFYHEQYPPGSLIKPFTVITYAAEHGDAFPQFRCPATAPRDPAGCWDRNGHGVVNLEKAIAFSCNVYFRQLAERSSAAVFSRILQDFGLGTVLNMPDPGKRKLMVGNTLEWTVQPALLLRAYCALVNGGRLWALDRSAARDVKLPAAAILQHLRKGMNAGGEIGTSMMARRIAGVPLLGKTGTSLLIKNGTVDWTRTQGWWIGLFPADHPEIAIMTFAPDGRGATDAAPLGGRVLAEYLKLTHAK